MSATVREVLRKRSDAIVERWIEEVLRTYPDGGQRFIDDRDAFRNPVGATVRRELPVLFDGVVGDADADAVGAALEALVRLRSVQGFPPSMALGFVFGLKRLIREHLDDSSGPLEKGIATLERRIDELALTAFDLYVQSRERLSELRVREAKAHIHSLLRRAEMLEDEVDLDPDSGGSDEKGGREV